MNSNSLDDIFGSSPPHEEPQFEHHQPESTVTTTEPSDLPSLRRQHVTAGYRDGLAASKSTQVQSGFDAGFPVGAQLGMRVGTVLGILEGAIRGLEVPRKVVRKGGSSSSSASSPSANVNAKGGVAGTRGNDTLGKGKDGAATVVGFEDLGSQGTGVDAGVATATAEDGESTREKKRAELLGLYRQAVRELDVRKVFEGVSADIDEGQNQDTTSVGGDQQKAKELPETKLARKAEEVVLAWEQRVRVALWEENMDALELKELSS
ncbi:Yae1 family protein [Aspergillus homomorphus CBS 101889]|uniref:Protein YAE1 n=1 Tax=Aspergillus homomorphus (strain CBS 101889) TaxID=1450537 RepID=A0A395HZA2_ASPHC|nr:hypothetical protein BO97DRAFT_405560 [Aspergillus homomorphus CBS 101889]RAL12198.1 hypothetical protein BO97DRAFT_405560 [Aspergillus homomorphus CBS 101889]